METKTATTTMLDEVSRDMRLEWPGSRRTRGRVPTESYERTPY